MVQGGSCCSGARLAVTVVVLICRRDSSDSSMVRQADTNTGESMARRQLTPDNDEVSSKERARKSSQTMPPRTTPPARYSHQGGTGWTMDPSKKRIPALKPLTADLSMSGVMPRRDTLPAPSSNPGFSRVFKVIFLG